MNALALRVVMTLAAATIMAALWICLAMFAWLPMPAQAQTTLPQLTTYTGKLANRLLAAEAAVDQLTLYLADLTCKHNRLIVDLAAAKGTPPVGNPVEGKDCAQIAAGAVLPGLLRPAPVKVAAIGPAGGTPFDFKCPAGQPLRGLKGNADTLFDGVQAVCGDGTLGPDIVGPWKKAFTSLCPDGDGVVGAQLRIADVALDQVTLACSGDGRLLEPISPAPWTPSSPAALACPAGRVAIGIHGTFGEQVTSLGLHCG